jgi:tetratricopeptide (TPR) repeat protein
VKKVVSLTGCKSGGRPENASQPHRVWPEERRSLLSVWAFCPFWWRALAVALIAALLSAPARAADPFYVRLLRQGTDAFNRHDYSVAVRELRIACFGFLDEPTLLADGLARLGLAQAAAGDEAGFRQTFQRLTEVEERFQGYSRAEIPRDVRAALEALMTQIIPQATLAGNPVFSRLVPTRQDAVAKLPPAQQRKELKRLIKSAPTEVRWRIMLAELELGEGNFGDAIVATDGALKNSPTNRDALRLRGLALAGQKKWPQAEADLEACGLAASDPRVADALLNSLVEQKRWQEACDLAAELPPGVAADPAVRDVSAVAALGLKASLGTAARPISGPVTPVQGAASPRTTQAAPGATAVEAASTDSAPLKQPAAGALDPAAKADLDEARTLTATGNLEAAFALAKKVADTHPDVAEAQFVAAELAYRRARWQEAVAYFRRGGDPGDGQPVRLFYEAVVLYEVGDRAAAAETLKRCLPNLRRTAFVEEYARKILGSPAKPSQEP